MLVTFGLLAALSYHFVAGIKHLLLDFHMGDSLQAAQNGAVIVIVATLLITAGVGALLW